MPEALSARAGSQPATASTACAESSTSAAASSPTSRPNWRRRARRAIGERERAADEHAATIRDAALAQARDEGDRHQLGDRAGTRREPGGRSDDLARRVLGHPLRECDQAALETVQIADLQAAAGRCERAMPAASARVAHVPAVAVAVATALGAVLAILALVLPGIRPALAAGAAIAGATALALLRARRGARTMRAALAERSAGWRIS